MGSSLGTASVVPRPSMDSGAAAPRLVLNNDCCVPSTLIERMQSKIQNVATPIVILVNRSPALVPKALCPPMPPSAPASPPPRPRWMRTSRIRKMDVATSMNPRKKRTNMNIANEFSKNGLADTSRCVVNQCIVRSQSGLSR